MPIESLKRRRDSKGDRIKKASYEIWNKLMKWLRLKKVKVMQDFKEECQWKWKYDENEDTLCIKINDKENNEHVHDKSNERRKVHVCKGKKKLSKHCYGVIGTFPNGALRRINKQ